MVAKDVNGSDLVNAGVMHMNPACAFIKVVMSSITGGETSVSFARFTVQ